MTVGDQWNLKMVKATEGLKLLPRLPDDGPVDWRGIEICHIDTGIRRHPALGKWRNGKSTTIRLEDGLNLQEPGTLPLDPMNYDPAEGEIEVQPGHGTRTASVICADQPGVYMGVAPGVPLIPYRATNGSILTKRRGIGVSEALEHAICKNGCEIASISLGSPFGAEPLGSIIDKAYEKGLIVVGAAGQVIDRVVYPGKYYRTIAVGGVTQDAKIWFNYNNTSFVDVWAPAKDVLRANSLPNPDAPDQFLHDVGPGEGTSYSCCHVAAAAAMWLTYHGEDLDNTYDEPWMRIEAFRTLLKCTGKSISSRALKGGTRILDIEALLKADLPEKKILKREARKAVVMRF